MGIDAIAHRLGLPVWTHQIAAAPRMTARKPRSLGHDLSASHVEARTDLDAETKEGVRSLLDALRGRAVSAAGVVVTSTVASVAADAIAHVFH